MSRMVFILTLLVATIILQATADKDIPCCSDLTWCQKNCFDIGCLLVQCNKPTFLDMASRDDCKCQCNQCPDDATLPPVPPSSRL